MGKKYVKFYLQKLEMNPRGQGSVEIRVDLSVPVTYEIIDHILSFFGEERATGVSPYSVTFVFSEHKLPHRTKLIYDRLVQDHEFIPITKFILRVFEDVKIRNRATGCFIER